MSQDCEEYEDYDSSKRPICSQMKTDEKFSKHGKSQLLNVDWKSMKTEIILVVSPRNEQRFVVETNSICHGQPWTFFGVSFMEIDCGNELVLVNTSQNLSRFSKLAGLLFWIS